MLAAYSLSLAGTSHALAGGVCQDASAHRRLSNGFVALAVADGLGSVARSDEGAALVVASVMNFLERETTEQTEIAAFPPLLEAAFSQALSQVIALAEAESVHPSVFDSTLTVAVFDGRCIAYGHVGDGGIVALGTDGRYRLVTSAMKGEEFNQVVPLRGRADRWSFGLFEEDAVALMVATDGIYDVLCPWLLADEEPPVYVVFARPFLDNALAGVDGEDRLRQVRDAAERYLLSAALARVTDDKTVAVCINTDAAAATLDDAYYADPDWQALHERKRSALYEDDAAGCGDAAVRASEAANRANEAANRANEAAAHTGAGAAHASEGV